jgi:hypothetical protein
MKNIKFSERTIPFALFFICVIAFGLLIPWLGFYWDDLPNLWFARQFGPQGALTAFQGDRPILGYLFMVTTALFGQNPLVWQIFGLLCRFLVVLAAWWTFKQVWPESIFQVTITAIFVAVFPGFTQQWISLIYSNVFLVMMIGILSIGFTMKAVRDPKRRTLYTILSVIFAAYNLFSLEYFIGQELLRPFFIWFILSKECRDWKTTLKKTIQFWLPTLIVFIIFLIWRTFFFSSDRYGLRGFENTKFGIFGFLGRLIIYILQNSIRGGLYPWRNVFFTPDVLDLTLSTSQWFWTIVALTAILVAFYLIFLKSSKNGPTKKVDQDRPNDKWAWQAILSGAVVTLFATLPYWAAGLSFTPNFPNDRFAISMMLSSSLLIAGLINLFISQRTKQIIIAVILIALSVGSQFITANNFKHEWEKVREFFWQLTWRAPGLEPDTMIISNELPFQYYTDNSLTGPLNWVYAPDLDQKEMPYLLVYARLRTSTGWLTLQPDIAVSMVYRITQFTANTSNSIALYLKDPGCVRLINKNNVNELLIQDSLVNASADLSDLSRVLVNDKVGSAAKPPSIFGSEPTHDWCFYYEKAELARQMNDWQTVVSLGDQAIQNHIGSYDPGEWLPFIEGYIRTNQLNRASERIEKVIEGIKGHLYDLKASALCTPIDRIKVDLGDMMNSEQNKWFITEDDLLKCKA